MAQEFLLVTQFVTAAAMLLLAGWLLWLKFESPVNRVFALFLVMRALQITLVRFERLADDPRWVGYWDAMAEHMFLAIPWVLLYFLVVFMKPRSAWPLRLSIVLAALATNALYLSDHCLNQCGGGDGLIELGPLSVIANAGPLALGFAGFWLAVDVVRQPQRLRDRAAAPIAVAFLLNAALDSSIAWAGLARSGWAATVTESYVGNLWQISPYIVFGLGLLPALAGLVVVSIGLRGRRRMSAYPFIAVGSAALVILSAIFVAYSQPAVRQEWSLFVVGLWRLALPAVVVYALLRHRLFGIEVKLHFAVKSSAIASVFAAAFFIGSELLEGLFDAPSAVLGLATAAVITLALKPIQWVAERIADRVVPDVPDLDHLSGADRAQLFRDKADEVWADGIVGPYERRLLDRLQRTLAIPRKQAASLEAQAADAFHRGRL